MDFMPKKKLGFGLMRMPQLDPNNGASVDVEQVKQMVDLFMEQGFTYFDTAWMYNGFASEGVAKEALVSRYPRESFTLATKLHNGFFNSLEGRDEVFNAQLEKTGAGYFDYYLLHGIEASSLPHYEKFDCFQWLLDKKAAGLVKHAGFSYHDNPELLDKILTDHPQMEFVQLQINYLDWESEWIQSRACYEVATKHGKPVIVMEPVKGGTLAQVPAQAEALLKGLDASKSVPSWAIRFVASLPNVMCVLSGMSNVAQMEDNISYMSDFVPLTEAEKDACFTVAQIINGQTAIGCTACHYCTDGCPMGIPIPDFFKAMNRKLLFEDEPQAKRRYANSCKKAGVTAADCIGCGQCEDACPQRLPIISYLERISEELA